MRRKERKVRREIYWKFLEHKGPLFPPPYRRLPKQVKFIYNGKNMTLSEPAEEVAGFYAKLLDTAYTKKRVFNENFFRDWRKVMTKQERGKITDWKKCDFSNLHSYMIELKEQKKNREAKEKLISRTEHFLIMEEYAYCTVDGNEQQIGNVKVELPGLFMGRGKHPKMGKIKPRIQAEDVTINCSANSRIPKPPTGHKWKDVIHDPTVTWLACWTDSIQKQKRYIILNSSSEVKVQMDYQKYETARRLGKHIDRIRKKYRENWKSNDMEERQLAVALYFIDKFALRIGNEKSEGKADTVGCCSLRVEHFELYQRRDCKKYLVVFDFLGKDSIRYFNKVSVEKSVFKNLELFIENKLPSDKLFDMINPAILNKHLNELMEGLTAKVFRTYNASVMLQEKLEQLTDPKDSPTEKLLSYNRANRAVAILCNHQRSVHKNHQQCINKIKFRITAKKRMIHKVKRQIEMASKKARCGNSKEDAVYKRKIKTLIRLKEELHKLELQKTNKEENKTVALQTSKMSYSDPRITVAWCKKHCVPVEKVFSLIQRNKFQWAINMAGSKFKF